MNHPTRTLHHAPRRAGLALLLTTLALPAWAAETCSRENRLANYPPMVSLRVDNDLLAGQDEGYTSGVGLTLVSPNLRDYVDDPCLPAPARLVNRYLEWLQPHGFDQQNMVVTIGQGIFTPGDGSRRDLIVDDRPYAGALLVGFGYNARKDNRLRTTQLVVGMVGPASLAEKTQNLIHKFTDSDKFEGWGNQLHNEPVLNLVHERLRRSEVRPLGNGGLQWDAVTHVGGSLGNLVLECLHRDGRPLGAARHDPGRQHLPQQPQRRPRTTGVRGGGRVLGDPRPDPLRPRPLLPHPGVQGAA